MNDPCVTVRELFWPTLDGDSQAVEQERLVAHLRGCADCRGAFAAAVRAHRLLLGAAVAESPAEVPVAARRPAVAAHLPITATHVRRSAGPGSAAWRRQPVRRGVPRLPVLLGLAALCVGIVALVVLHAPGRPGPWAEVVAAQGLRCAGAPADVGRILMPGDALVATGEATVRLRDGSRIVLAPGTRLTFDTAITLRVGGRSGTWLGLDEGGIAVVAAKQDVQAPLAIDTPLAEAVVVGTSFRIGHGAAGSDLEVASGRVRFLAAGRAEVVVAAGGQAHAAPPTAPAQIVASFDAAAPDALIMNGEHVSDWRASAPAGSGLAAAVGKVHEMPTTRTIAGRRWVSFDDHNQCLTAPLPPGDARAGLTLLVVAMVREFGAGHRAVVLSADGGEDLALVRLGGAGTFRMAVLVDGDEIAGLPVSAGQALALACRWRADGTVTLRAPGGVMASGRGRPPPPRISTLQFGSIIDHQAFMGDLAAVELVRGELDDAALSARLEAFAAAHGASPAR